MNLDEEEVLIRDDSSVLLDVGSVTSARPATWRSKMAKTACLSLAFFALGLCIAIPGPTLLDLGDQVGASTAEMMILFASRSVGYLVGAVLGGVLFDCFDKQLLLFNTLLISSVATVAIPWCQTLSVMGAMFGLQGLTMGALDTGGNIFCVRIWGRKNGSYLQTIHFAFGIGAFIAPLLATPFLSNSASNSTQLIQGNIPVSPFLPQHINASRSIRSEELWFASSDSEFKKMLQELEKVRKFKRDVEGDIQSSSPSTVSVPVTAAPKVDKNISDTAASDADSNDIPKEATSDNANAEVNKVVNKTASTSQKPPTENRTEPGRSGDTNDQANEHEEEGTSNAGGSGEETDTGKENPDITKPKKPVAATDEQLHNSFSDGKNIDDHVQANKKQDDSAGINPDEAVVENKQSETSESEEGKDKTTTVAPSDPLSPQSNGNGTGNTSEGVSGDTSKITPASPTTAKLNTSTTTPSGSADSGATAASGITQTANNSTAAQKLTTAKLSIATTTPKPATTTPKPTTTQKPTTTTTTPKPTTTTPKPTTTTTTTPKTTTTQKPTTTTTTPKPTTTTTITPKPTTTTTTPKPTTTEAATPHAVPTAGPPFKPPAGDKTPGASKTSHTSASITSKTPGETSRPPRTSPPSSATTQRVPEKPTTAGDFFQKAVKAMKNISKIQFAYMIIGFVLFVNAVMFLVLYCKGKRRFWTAPDHDEYSHVKNEGCCFQGTLVLFLGLFFFCYVGIEVTYGALVSTFAIEFNAWPKTQGATVAAIFWGSMAVGRGFSIFLARCCGPTIMLIIDVVLMVSGGACLSVGIYYYIKLLWLGTLILGLGMSSAFPAAISWAEKYFNLTGKATAVFIVGSALGQMVIPILTGYFYEKDGMALMKATLGVSVIAFVIFFLMQCFALKMSGRMNMRDRNGFLPLEEAEEEDNMEMDLVHFDKTQLKQRRDRRGQGSAEYQTLISDLDDD